MASQNPAKVHGLGEIAIRCADLAPMVAFYCEIVGLSPLKEFPESRIAFFHIAPGHGGHTTVLALFDARAEQRDFHDQGEEPPRAGATSTLHHLALAVDYDQQDALCAFLSEKGIAYTVQDFAWIGWRGVFIKDPEGNTVEFVAGVPHDPTA